MERNEKALNLIFMKYEEIFKYFLYKNHVNWKDYDSLLGEGRYLIYYCLQVYNGIHPFFAFYKLCAIRLIMRHFRKQKIKEVNIEGFEISSSLKESQLTEPITIIYTNKLQEQIGEGIKNGKKLNEIAQDLNLNPKKVYYEFSKLKKTNLKKS